MVGDSGWQAGASHHFPSLPQVSANGNVLRSEIVGSIKMRVFLSGMPELRLGLNDKVLFDNTGREYPRPGRPCALEAASSWAQIRAEETFASVKEH